MSAVATPASATPRARWVLWTLLLAGAAALAVFGDKTPSGAGAARPGAVAASAAPRPAPAAARRPQVLEPIEPLLPRASQASAALPPRGDLFATPSWRRPPPPPPAAAAAPAAPPPPPQAPALPYRVIGKKLDGSTWELFLGRDDTPFVVREGDTVESVWRVQRIAPPQATFKHLATGQERGLDIGPAP